MRYRLVTEQSGLKGAYYYSLQEENFERIDGKPWPFWLEVESWSGYGLDEPTAKQILKAADAFVLARAKRIVLKTYET